MRSDLQALFMALVDRCAKERRAQARRSAETIVDPDLDGVNFFRGELLHGASDFGFGGDLVRDARIRGTAGPGVRCADAAASNEQARSARLPGRLIGAN